MTLLNSLIQASNAQRIAELEMRAEGYSIRGDFEGSVVGYWVKLEQNGGGTVSYNNKLYLTKPIGFTSLPAGAEVELSHANGVYFSKF